MRSMTLHSLTFSKSQNYLITIAIVSGDDNPRDKDNIATSPTTSEDSAQMLSKKKMLQPQRWIKILLLALQFTLTRSRLLAKTSCHAIYIKKIEAVGRHH